MSENKKRLHKQLALDAAVSKFEEAWHQDSHPKIENWITQYREMSPTELFEELLGVEVEFRFRRFELVKREDYESRFPDYLAVIAKIFETQPTSDMLSYQVDPTETVAMASIDTDVSEEGPIHPTLTNDSKRIIGDYQLLEEVGRGGMGQVFRARQISLGREVALKLIRYDMAYSSASIKRLKNEAQTVAKLEHSNIVSILDYGSDGKFWYFVMPMLRGGTLGAPKPATTVFEKRAMLEKIALIAEAVDFAHQQNVIHRDLKPANILLDENHCPYVGDFGLARTLDAIDATQTAGLLGTPMFLSPEQASGGKVGRPTDIHAIGAILYHQLAGKYPFYSQNTVELIKRIELEIPQSLIELDPSTPRDLNTITMKCLEKDPTMRYATAGELAADIRRYLDGFPIVARQISMPERVWRWSKRNRLLATSIGLMACLLFTSSLAALSYRGMSQSQSRLKAAAQEQRDDAVNAAEMERKLRKEAEHAKLDAEDASIFAYALQRKATVKAFQVALESGNYSALQNISINKSNLLRDALDIKYIGNGAKQQLPVKSYFCYGDWDALDSAISPDEKYLAVVDESGLIEVREIASGKLTKRLASGSWHTTKKRYFRRIDLGTENAVGQTPVQYHSSISWKNDHVLLAANLDGELVKFELGDEEVAPNVVFKTDHPLRFVRTNKNGTLVVVDDRNELFLLSQNFELSKSKLIEEEVTCIKPINELGSWIIGDQKGNVSLLDRQLEVVSSAKLDGTINDLVLDSADDDWFLYVSSGNSPVKEYRFDPVKNKFKHPAEFRLSRRPPYHQYLAVEVDEKHNQLVAMDNFGMLQMWSLRERAFLAEHPIGRPQDNRDDQKIKDDSLSSRTGLKVKKLNAGLLTISRTAGVKLVDPSVQRGATKWNSLKSRTGKSPQIVASPINAGHIWVQDFDGNLSIVGLVEDRIVDQVPNAHGGGKSDICAMNNGDVLTAGSDNFVKLWKFSDGKIQEKRRFKSQHRLVSVGANEERGIVASVTEDGRIVVWELASGKLIREIQFPVVQSDAAELETWEVNTGDLAFSKTGKYMAAFGTSQEFEIFETENFSRVDATAAMVSGPGGSSVCFSPSIEHRLLVSSNGLSGVAVTDGNRQMTDRRLQERPKRARCLNIISTHRGDRLVGVTHGGEILCFSPDHFVILSEISTPVRNCNSIALGAQDSSIIIGKKDGTFQWCKVESRNPIDQPVDKITGVVHQLLNTGQGDYRPFGAYGAPYFCAGRDGHLAGVLSVGWSDGNDGTLYLFRKQGDKWKVEEVQVDDEQPGTYAKPVLSFRPDGKALIATRQELTGTGAYNGRLVLIHENERALWDMETVISDGNAGWGPFVIADEMGKVERIVHCDMHYYQLVESVRPDSSAKPDSIGKDWPTRNLRGFGGYNLTGKKSSNSCFHLFFESNRGFADRLPSFYFRYQPQEESYDFAFGAGRKILSASSQSIVSYDSSTGIFYRFENKKWSELTKFPAETQSANPFVDDAGQIWICDNLGREILVYRFAKGRWQHAKVTLDTTLVPAVTYCSMNRNGKLEIACYQHGVDGSVSIVELERPLKFDDSESASE